MAFVAVDRLRGECGGPWGSLRKKGLRAEHETAGTSSSRLPCEEEIGFWPWSCRSSKYLAHLVLVFDIGFGWCRSSAFCALCARRAAARFRISQPWHSIQVASTHYAGPSRSHGGLQDQKCRNPVHNCCRWVFIPVRVALGGPANGVLRGQRVAFRNKVAGHCLVRGDTPSKRLRVSPGSMKIMLDFCRIK